MSTKFFERVIGYSAPLVPRNEIPEAEVGQRRAYYRVMLDDAGRVINITKMLDSQIEIQFAYQYDNLGRLTGAQITDTNGNSRALDVPSERAVTVTTRT